MVVGLILQRLIRELVRNLAWILNTFPRRQINTVIATNHANLLRLSTLHATIRSLPRLHPTRLGSPTRVTSMTLTLLDNSPVSLARATHDALQFSLLH